MRGPRNDAAARDPRSYRGSGGTRGCPCRVRRRLLRRQATGECRRAGELDAGVHREPGACTEASATAGDRLADVGFRRGSQPDLSVRAPSSVQHRLVVRREAARRVSTGRRLREAHLHEQSGCHVLGRCEDRQGGVAPPVGTLHRIQPGRRRQARLPIVPQRPTLQLEQVARRSHRCGRSLRRAQREGSVDGCHRPDGVVAPRTPGKGLRR